MEVGIGIHGEPGRERLPMTRADAIAEKMASAIIEDGAYTRSLREWDGKTRTWVEKEITKKPFKSGDPVFALVNSMGGTPLLELYIVYRKLAEIYEKSGPKIVRSMVGSYITSLEMQDCSITLVKMDQELIRL